MGKLDYGWGMRSITPRKHLFAIETYTPSREAKRREEWMRYYQEKKNAALTCRHFDIPKKTFWKWYKRYQEKGIRGLEDISRKPHHIRERMASKELVHAILEVRDQHPEWSKYKIHQALEERYHLHTSLSSIGRILKDHNRILPRESKKRRRAMISPVKRVSQHLKVSVNHPGGVVHIDTKHLWQNGCPKMYHFTAIDAYSRFKHARTYTSISSRSARKFFEEFLLVFPYPVERVISDNGSEYQGEFHQFLLSRKIEHFFTYPYTPKQNAIAERAIRTDIEEFYHNGGLKMGVKEQNEALKGWNYYYNHERYHRSLGCLTPIQFLAKFELLNRHPSTEP